jgi:hypothetical protein
MVAVSKTAAIYVIDKREQVVESNLILVDSIICLNSETDCENRAKEFSFSATLGRFYPLSDNFTVSNYKKQKHKRIQSICKGNEEMISYHSNKVEPCSMVEAILYSKDRNATQRQVNISSFYLDNICEHHFILTKE